MGTKDFHTRITDQLKIHSEIAEVRIERWQGIVDPDKLRIEGARLLVAQLSSVKGPMPLNELDREGFPASQEVAVPRSENSTYKDFGRLARRPNTYRLSREVV